MKKTLLLCTTAAGAAFALAFNEPSTPATGSLTGLVLSADAGKVVFDGEKPEIKPLEIDAEKAKGCAAEGASVDKSNQSLLIGANGGIANVVVLVEVAGATVKPLEKAFELDQKTCRFEPHVAIVPAGSSVEMINSDTISHNVHTYAGKNESMNKMIGAGTKETQKLDKEDRIEIKCDIHPWMNSYLIVANTNFYAVTGADGSFKIDGLPAGEHKVEYWHETLGKQKGTIKVGADGKIEPIELKWSLQKKEGRGRRG